MFKRSPEQIQSLAAVMRAPGGRVFWEMLIAMAQDKDREARKLEGPTLYRAQGAAEAFEQLASDMEATVRDRVSVLAGKFADPAGRTG